MFSLKSPRFIFKIGILLLSFFLIAACERLEIEKIVKIVTRPVIHISYHEATVTGAILDFGEGKIIQYGHCYAKHEHPSMLDPNSSHTSLDTMNQIGQFYSIIEDLDPGTKYYYCAYCYDGKEIFYGEIMTFNTVPITFATIVTNDIINISADSAQCGGNIVSDGGDSIQVRGVCWNTSPGQTVGNYKTQDGSGIGSFISTLKDLIPDTTYYVRAYATNKYGTSYGNELNFVTKDGVPVLSTTMVTGITANSAVSGGVIKSDGYLQVLSRGVCWDTLQNPDITDSITIDGEGIGSFTSKMKNLLPGRTYYVRAYATNKYDTFYAKEEWYFNTKDGLPKLTTREIRDITTGSAASGGFVTDDGGLPVISRGVCWSTMPNPTTADDTTWDGEGKGSFISYITGLDASTTYYIRAYATNTAYTAYGMEYSFKTYHSTVSDVDGNMYYAIQIGDQIWMARNLAVTHYRNGDAITNIVPDTAWTKAVTGAYSNPFNDDVTYLTYGRYYNFYAAKDSRIICPDGWHLPAEEEWTQLVTYLGGEAVAGGKMKEAGTNHWASPNEGATNESGFTALGAGRRHYQGATEFSSSAYWWGNAAEPYSVVLINNSAEVIIFGGDRNDGNAVRCIKD
jgi:uncharacterized protein (TIGR02145 family)